MSGPAAAIATKAVQKPTATATVGQKTAVEPERQPKGAAHGSPAPNPAAIPADPPESGRWQKARAPRLASPQGILPPKLAIGSINDPLEREAESFADRTMRSSETATAASAFGGAPRMGVEAPPIVREILRRPGRPLNETDRAYFELRLGWDLSDIRIHDGLEANASARAVSAQAFTLGRDVVFAEGAYEPQSSRGRRLLAHELAHVAQQQSSTAFGVLQRQSGPVAGRLKAGDDVSVQIYGAPTDVTPDQSYSRTYRVNAQGAIVFPYSGGAATIVVAGASAPEAAQKIADGLVGAELFRGPRVCVTGPGMTAPVCANAKTAMSPQVATAYANFLNYIKTTTEPAAAVSRYHQWIVAHRDYPEFLRVSPPDLWALSLREPERPKDPVAERTDEWIRFMKSRLAENAKLHGEEQARATETLRRFQDYYDQHHGDADFVKGDPAKIYADISVGQLKTAVEESARKKVEAAKQAAADSPEAFQAKSAKFDEFLSKAMKLWGYSTRSFPYSIPLDAEGKDILVTGDPALQRVLDTLAQDLMNWAGSHLSDANFATASVNQVLLDLLKGGYSAKIAEAQKQQLQHETIDRNELLAKSALARFGETVAEGLLVVGVAGLLVGAEIATAGQVTWVLGGLAAWGGMSSYFTRRDEIERSGYDVPVAETMVHSVGDIVGLSQLVEGVTGRRLGTDQPLGSEARTQQFAAGAGNITTILLGSRAYRAGQNIGQSARLSGPGLKPSGPNANVPVPPLEPRPAAPQANPTMGPVESAARGKLPENLRAGLDLWSAEMRQNGGNPENVFGRLKPDKIQSQAETFLKRYEKAVEAADRSAQQAVRAKDDPLRPKLRNVRPASDSRVTLHYENQPPAEHEIAQAIEIAKRTGEQIHLFGDTASGIQYPGIDGTIGEPPRPLSLKFGASLANANYARFAAAEALSSADAAGYTHVEVRIEMPGSTIAEVRAGWNAPPPRATDPVPGPAFKGSVVARVVIHCSDGELTMTPTLSGPPLTGVSPIPKQPDQPDQKEKP